MSSQPSPLKYHMRQPPASGNTQGLEQNHGSSTLRSSTGPGRRSQAPSGAASAMPIDTWKGTVPRVFHPM